MTLAIIAIVLALFAIVMGEYRAFTRRCVCEKKDTVINNKLVRAAENQAGDSREQ